MGDGDDEGDSMGVMGKGGGGELTGERTPLSCVT